MAYWLMKSEPNVFSWDDLKAVKTEPWDGVKNYQARNNMKAMKKGELCFFYHSNIGKEIVGIMEIAKEHYPAPDDERFVQVDVKWKKPFKTPVTLEQIKAEPRLQDIALIRQSRLSVMPITDKEWKILCTMGGIEA